MTEIERVDDPTVVIANPWEARLDWVHRHYTGVLTSLSIVGAALTIPYVISLTTSWEADTKRQIRYNSS